MMKNIKNVLYLAIFSTVVVVIWIILTLVHNHDTSTISEDLNAQIVPLNPSFDTGTINSLSNRSFITVDLSKNSPLASGSAFQKNLSTLSNELGASQATKSGGISQ